MKEFIDEEFEKLSPILENVFRDVKIKKEGENIYSSWGKNNFTWTLQDYAHEGFQGIYVQKLFKNRARLTKKAMVKALESNNSQLSTLHQVLLDARTVSSLGCGPGPELIGFQAFLREQLPIDPSDLEMQFTGYDAVASWKKYHEKLGTSFVEQNIDETFLQNFPDVDIVITSYFASSVSLSDRNPDRSSNWDKITSKCRLVIVLDMNDPHQRNSLKKRGFIEFSVNDEREVLFHIKII